jgi:threonine dehydrogenase-like Zn-dependent dehydrogenase
MRAAIMDAPHKMRVGEWVTPQIGIGEVLVAVGATGICAGDIYLYKGINPYAVYPVIGGHEIAGIVAAVGDAVASVAPGDRVVVNPFIGCGHCYPCRVGKHNCCANLQIIGVHRPGGFAEYVVAPSQNIHHIPTRLSLAFAALAEPVAIGVQACRRGQVGAEYVLILGCGPIGLALIEVARARGAYVVATDLLDDRVAMARTLGAKTLKSDERLLTTVLEQTNGEGAPVVIEATGNLKAMESTVDLVASGGRIVIVGLGQRGQMVQMPALDFTRKEMSIFGSRASVNCFPEALELLASGALTYPKYATEFSMWEAPTVFARLDKDPSAVHKGVLVRESLNEPRDATRAQR